MGELVSFRLPKDLQKELAILSKEEDRDKSEMIRDLIKMGLKEKKIEKAIKLYKEGKISASRAAEIAGISLWRMLEVFRERGIGAQYGPKELEEDLKSLR